MSENGQSLVIESTALRERASLVKVGGNGLAPRNLAELMDFGQLMAKAGPMVGKAFRGNPGACVAITMRAMNWNMDPFAVSQKAYVTVDKFGNEHIGYEAQLIAAVIHSRAPIKNRPDYDYTGAGPNRVCIVSATFKRENKPKIYTSPVLSQIAGKSPLWNSDQDQQLGYYSIRAWSRRFCPELIMGVYTPEELQDFEPINVTPVSVEDYDQRPAEERAPRKSGPFMKGRAAEDAVDAVIATMDGAETPEALAAAWAHAQTMNVSQNRQFALGEVQARNEERIANGEPPRNAAAPCPFDDMKEAGLECLQRETPEAKQEAFEVWAGSLTDDKLGACTEAQRTELRTLYKSIKTEIAG